MAENSDFNSVNRVNQPSEKICKGKCGKMKPLSDFNNNRTKKDGKQEICRQCQSEFMKDYNAQRAYERRQQLTAGDVQLDPAPEKVKLPSAKAPRPAGNEVSKPKKVKLPEPTIKQEVQAIVKEVAAMPRAPMNLTDEEKAIIVSSLDRHVAVIERIIEKLSV